jgi:hypothetical protein
VPLVACDPYFSIWSPHDHLNAGDTTHWTGKPHRLECLARIDGTPHQLMGKWEQPAVPALPQTKLELTPTRTIYTFAGAGVSIRMTFTTPALPENLDVLARPVTYVSFDALATDGRNHKLSLDFLARAEIVVNTPDQAVALAEVPGIDGLAVLRAGSVDQAVLAKAGDDLRIDWGYLYLAAPKEHVERVQTGPHPTAKDGANPAKADQQMLLLTLNCGEVTGTPVSRWLMLAYDDLFSIQYMKHNLRPYWRRNGWEAADLLKASARDYVALKKRCGDFDAEFTADLIKAGGESYADLGVLAYRQCFAAGKFVADSKGQPLQFCKENHSNGCIGTSDVFYPMAPQFLLLGPTLAKSFLVPFMNYAASERWRFPFAPHDLGTYPHANGQVYGGGERTEDNQMPVEESGNLLLLFAAIAQMEGNAGFAADYWPQLSQWADYLKAKGFDPENQLCTDDFAGHLAHNVNLSAKAICALGAFAKICAMRGDQAKADEFSRLAKDFAARWVKEADDGGCFRLAFDRPGTWSQKYNLVWDRILGLDLFPAAVLRKELDHYLKTQNQYGLPLDNRKDYTKLDWVLWTASLTQDRRDFDAILAPVRRFLQETPDRSPMTDWYDTKNARKVGFTARPVVGGVFIQMLYQKPVWAKYAGRDRTKGTGWAPMPKPPVLKHVVPGAAADEVRWRHTSDKPAADWFRPGFDASAWKEGRAGFGARGTPGAIIGTEWTSSDIWLRREFQLPDCDLAKLALWLHHDEDAEVFLNGVPAASASGFSADYAECPISDQARSTLRPGVNVIAIHCRQSRGGQYIDAGLCEVHPAAE